MANYYAYTRTNYFGVKDEEKFRNIISSLVGENTFRVWKKDVDGKQKFGFGSECNILGKINPSAEDEEYYSDEWIQDLQAIVDEDDAIIITEVGYEKLCYLVGGVIVITSNSVTYGNIESLGLSLARDALKNPKFETQMHY